MLVKIISFIAILVCCVGCASSTTKLPVANQPTKTNTTEWDWIADGDWGWQLPPGYAIIQSTKQSSNNSKAYQSKNITLVFLKDKTNSDLETYASSLAWAFKTLGAEIVDARSGHISNLNAALLVVRLSSSTMTYQFVVVHNGMAYNFACGGRSDMAEQMLLKCITIAKTIRIKQ